MPRPVPPFLSRRAWLRLMVGLFAGFALLLAGYIVAGLVGGAIPTNMQRTPPERGIPVWVADNGIHVSLILPYAGKGAGADWRDLVRPEDISDPRYAAHTHLGFGWGERGFYLNTPTWWDLRPATLLHAGFGSDASVVHVDHLPEPEPGPAVRRILLRPHEYRRLTAYIRASFATGADGRAPSVPGYGPADAFYTAHGRYSALRTCNVWIGDALRYAGVHIGLWTPFPVTIMGWLPPHSRPH